MKNLYRGVFSFNQFVERPLYAHAHTERQAWKIMCDRLAKKHEVNPAMVYGMFDGSKQNYEITIETEFKEA